MRGASHAITPRALTDATQHSHGLIVRAESRQRPCRPPNAGGSITRTTLPCSRPLSSGHFLCGRLAWFTETRRRGRHRPIRTPRGHIALAMALRLGFRPHGRLKTPGRKWMSRRPVDRLRGNGVVSRETPCSGRPAVPRPGAPGRVHPTTGHHAGFCRLNWPTPVLPEWDAPLFHAGRCPLSTPEARSQSSVRPSTTAWTNAVLTTSRSASARDGATNSPVRHGLRAQLGPPGVAEPPVRAASRLDT